MIKTVEYVMDIYYRNSFDVLYILGWTFFTVLIAELTIMQNRLFEIIKKMSNRFFLALMCIFVGYLLYWVGVEIHIRYDYFNIIMFLGLIGLVLIYTIFQICFFREWSPILIHMGKWVQFVLYVELFLLGLTQHLELIECVVAILVIGEIELLGILFSYLKKEKKQVKRKDSDYPNPELYPTRERQLDNFIRILQQQIGEPYTVMISGKWGTGKTSFVQALQRKLKEDEFIWIEAGSEKSVSDIMLEISEEIIKILNQNNIYVESKSLIEKYFMAFAGMIDNTGSRVWDKLFGVFFHNQEETNGKWYINERLEQLKKVIYIVVDDLDRCDYEYQMKMFKVIRECTTFNKCKTIFMVDKEIFLKEGDKACDIKYIEKYVNFTLDICDVSYQEIIDYYILEVFNTISLQSIDDRLFKGREEFDIIKMISEYPINQIENINLEIQKIGNKNKTKTDKLKEMVLEAQNNITNSRRVKNYIKGIKRDLDILSISLNENDNREIREDWFYSIVEVQYIKWFLPKYFQNMQMCKDFYEYLENYKDTAFEFILDLKGTDGILAGKKEELLNHIIYKLNYTEIDDVKTKRELYLSELRGKQPCFKNINAYIKYAENYADYRYILNVYSSNQDKNEINKESFIKLYMQNIQIFINDDINELNQLSISFIDIMKETGVSKKQKEIIIYEGKQIVKKLLLSYSYLIKTVLYIVYPINRVEELWIRFTDNAIKELYEILCKLENTWSQYKQHNIPVSEMNTIISFFKRQREKIESNLNDNIGIEKEKLFSDIFFVLNICELWNGIEQYLNEESFEVSTFNQYFSLEYLDYREKVFSSVYHLERGLDELKRFYVSRKDKYESKFSILFYRILLNIIIQAEKDEFWFDGMNVDLNNIISVIKEIAQIIYRIDAQRSMEEKIIIENIKILMYKIDSLSEGISLEEEEEHTDDSF